MCIGDYFPLPFIDNSNIYMGYWYPWHLRTAVQEFISLTKFHFQPNLAVISQLSTVKHSTKRWVGSPIIWGKTKERENRMFQSPTIYLFIICILYWKLGCIFPFSSHLDNWWGKIKSWRHNTNSNNGHGIVREKLAEKENVTACY